MNKVREACNYAKQLSTLLDLLSKKREVLVYSQVSPIYSASSAHSAVVWHEARLQALGRACTCLVAAKERLVQERKVDSRFVDSLQALCDNWNVRPIISRGGPQVPQAGNWP